MLHSQGLRKRLAMLTAIAALSLGGAPSALAEDGGVDASETSDASARDAAANIDDASEDAVPLACDGALCASTNGGELGGSCAVGVGQRVTSSQSYAIGVGLVLLGLRGRRRAASRRAQKGASR